MACEGERAALDAIRTAKSAIGQAVMDTMQARQSAYEAWQTAVAANDRANEALQRATEAELQAEQLLAQCEGSGGYMPQQPHEARTFKARVECAFCGREAADTWTKCSDGVVRPHCPDCYRKTVNNT